MSHPGFKKLMMKRLLIAVLFWVAVWGLMDVNVAAASPNSTSGLPVVYLADVSMPSLDDLTSMTPTEKKQFFLKKKGALIPTTEEITGKIEAGFKTKGMELPAGVKAKIDAGLKRKSSFIPSPEAIAKKIEAAMSAFKK